MKNLAAYTGPTENPITPYINASLDDDGQVVFYTHSKTGAGTQIKMPRAEALKFAQDLARNLEESV